MRSSIFAAFFVSTLAIAGCSADAQHTDDEGDAPATLQADALSKLGKTVVGSYKSEAWYPRFELKADGTYTWDTGIRCVRAPCPSGDAGSWKIYHGASGSSYVNLVSKPAGEDRWFRIYSGPPVVLKGVFGTTGTFTKEGSGKATCATTLCEKGSFCDESTGSAKCIKYTTCADGTTKCDAGFHCEDTPIVCITTPCNPTAPSCVPDDKCMTVRCAAGYTCQANADGTVGCVALSKDFCNSAADCVLVDDYCGGCNCLPLASWATPPKCSDPVSCFVEPCAGKTVACESNHCVVR